MTTITPDWCYSHDELVEFGELLSQTLSVSELQYYYEKPWKYDLEHQRWNAAGRPEDFDLEG